MCASHKYKIRGTCYRIPYWSLGRPKAISTGSSERELHAYDYGAQFPTAIGSSISPNGPDSQAAIGEMQMQMQME